MPPVGLATLPPEVLRIVAQYMTNKVCHNLMLQAGSSTYG